MKKSILIALVLLLVNMAAAQAQVRVTGTVTSSEDGTSVPFATIIVKGERGVGAATDLDGVYTLENVAPDAVLVFSYIGFVTQEIPVNGRTQINVVLDPDFTRLDEVMVVAYGTATKGTFTGAASVVSDEAIRDVPTISFENALGGKVPGLQVTSLSGQAGSSASIRIRGIGSMNASNEPLFVVDGVPVISGATGQLGGYIYTTNSAMNAINPNDIEAITVLKDAAASALYGSRAANGVILITTKKGKLGRPIVNFKASVAISPDWAYNNWEPANDMQQIEMIYEKYHNTGLYYGETLAQANKRAIDQLNNRFNRHGYTFSAPDNTYNSLTIGGERNGEFYNWDEYLFGTGVYQTYDLSVSGATDATNYYVSLSYLSDQGRIKINEYDRISARVNLSQKVGRIAEFTTNINFSNSNKVGLNDTRNTGTNPVYMHRNLLFGMYWPYDFNGDPWSRYGSLAYNPVYYDNEWENFSKTNRISLSETMSIKILEDLNLRSVISYDNSRVRDHLYYSPNHYSGVTLNGRVIETMTDYTKLVSSTTLNYNKTFGQKHTLGVLVGFEAEKNDTDYTRAEGSDLPTTALKTVVTAGTKDANAYSWGRTMASVLSRAEYNYDNKYYVSGSFRRDGSSRLAPATRWGNFWSVAASWRIDREDFMSNVDFISSLRLRASHGVNGILPSADFGWRSLTTYTNQYVGKPGSRISTVADERLRWETNYTTNLALEFGLFDQRITGTVEVYNRDSKDLLQNVPISRVTGFASTLQNIGLINNKGIEIELYGEIIKTRDLTWGLGITASHVNSKVMELYEGQDIIWWDPSGDSHARFIFREGESTLALYGYEYAGLEKATGLPLWFLNNDGTPDNSRVDGQPMYVDGRSVVYFNNFNRADMVVYGDIHPKLYGGINTDLEWKGLSVGLNFIYKIGGYSYDGAARDVIDDGYYGERVQAYEQYRNRWTYENQDGKLPQRLSIGSQHRLQRGSRDMNPADFIRLKNLNIGYNIPSRITQPVGISNARVYFSGMNLWTWAKYDVYDPEIDPWGVQAINVPLTKTYTFGIDITF